MPYGKPTQVLGSIAKRVAFPCFLLMVVGVIWLVYVLTFVGTTAGSVVRIEDSRVIVSFQLPNGDRREQAYPVQDASSEYRVGDSVTVYCLSLIKGGHLYWVKGERWYLVAWKLMGGWLVFGIAVCLLVILRRRRLDEA